MLGEGGPVGVEVCFFWRQGWVYAIDFVDFVVEELLGVGWGHVCGRGRRYAVLGDGGVLCGVGVWCDFGVVSELYVRVDS